MAKRKTTHVDRAQLSMLLPINTGTKTVEVSMVFLESASGRFLNLSESRQAALKNLEKSGLRPAKK